MINSLFTWLGVEATPFQTDLAVSACIMLLCFGIILLLNSVFDAVLNIFRGRR